MSRKNKPTPRGKDLNMMSLFRTFISKLDSTWARLAVIGVFLFTGYKIGRAYEEVINTKAYNKIENEYNKDLLNIKEKYINENIILNRKISELENQINLLKAKYEQGKKR